ncbi:hypothetical protein FBEOM_7547 [Fusarium beomiforme]|uniref:Uncharacterized protein n=1 Tax=Fusarium beomiforme TaxID=44412 RepID=A0A9P5AH03_9HYPO|nr:hypothetical protein FBEOM_7547 [Fusarium beomiforme]
MTGDLYSPMTKKDETFIRPSPRSRPFAQQGQGESLKPVIATLEQWWRDGTVFSDAVGIARDRAEVLFSDSKTGKLVGAALVEWQPLLDGENKIPKELLDFIRLISQGYHALYHL